MAMNLSASIAPPRGAVTSVAGVRSRISHRQPTVAFKAVSRSPLSCSCAAEQPQAGLRESIAKLASKAGQAAFTLALSTSLAVGVADARMEGVNKPELLPTGDFTPVIDVAGFLTTGEEARIRQEVEDLEADTGFKLRVLAQNYPETPGLAIKDYWGVDGDTVVFVADPNTCNILNFNVGENVDLAVPRNFWTRLASKYGNKFFWQEQGEASAMLNAVSAISTCLHEPIGRSQCTNIQGLPESMESLF